MARPDNSLSRSKRLEAILSYILLDLNGKKNAFNRFKVCQGLCNA